MKIQQFIIAAISTFVSISSVFAASSLTDSQAVMLGFRSVAVADASVITNSANAGKFLFVGLDGYNQQSDIQLNSILTSTFGANWYNNGGDIKWGIFGASPFDFSTPEASAASGYVFFGATPGSGFTLANADWDNGYQAYASVIDAIKANLSSEGISTNAAGIRYGTLASGDVVGTESQLTEKLGQLTGLVPGTSFAALYDFSANRSLDINYLMPNDERAGFGEASITGVITLAENGNLTVVPEPSTYALFALGGLVIGVAIRRARTL
jgi:hypothetical protein